MKRFPQFPKPPLVPQSPNSYTVSPARREAFSVLLEVENTSAHADDLLRSPRVSALSAPDRHLTTTLVMGTLRWQIRLDAAIRPLLNKPNARLDPEIQTALRLGAFQLLHLDRIPAHAAISESVALAKQAGHKFASGMVNAVLRKVAIQRNPNPATPDQFTPQNARELAQATAHPEWLVTRWIANYSFEQARAIANQGQRQPELSIRLANPELESELQSEGIELAPGIILTAARRVLSGDVTKTQAFLTGQVRIQEEGSQLIAELAGQGINILDACAAPGGKTLILAERNPQAQITANEISSTRLAAMRQRFTSLKNPTQHANILFLNADAAQLPGSLKFDLVLADVPCSGTGTLGRNPEIRHRLQPADLTRHQHQQCAILKGALRAASVSPIARIVYSTCSLEPEENSQVIDEVLAASAGWRQVSVATKLIELQGQGRLNDRAAQSLLAQITPDGSLTILPGSLGPDISTEGFFMTMIEKHA